MSASNNNSFLNHLQNLHFAASGDITPGKMKLECELRDSYRNQCQENRETVYHKRTGRTN
ncbi:hypothetical protein PROFUN_16336 [Planoprotostelium fungivorum]|uniref:Uncharacterized protein n=1 Tax=Planoprotostelium fungivorum TaxID=1890364 RepID=A0A2P6MR77_9EUKA|nr:hypothetical protein PROFUN_16336 [Planoprotostelium fungivorum]